MLIFYGSPGSIISATPLCGKGTPHSIGLHGSLKIVVGGASWDFISGSS